MRDVVSLVDPRKIRRNPENPRLIFRQVDLDALRDSIEKQGILVPLTIFRDKTIYYLLDGERRWRCALKLGLPNVPVIIQPTPQLMQNIMMMFAIHNARRDWNPLPTALKLEKLEKEFTRRYGKKPNEIELAGIASLSRGEVRRLKKLLGLPKKYRRELLHELEKPDTEQEITVDQVLETTKAAESLRKRKVIYEATEELLRTAILQKFRSGIVNNTVAPRKLVKLARAVHRNDVSRKVAARAISKLIEDPNYSINAAFKDTVEQADFGHSIEQLASRLMARLDEYSQREYEAPESFLRLLERLAHQIRLLLKQ